MNTQHTMKLPMISHRQVLDYLGSAGLVIAITAGTAAVFAGLGSKWGWWHFPIGFIILEFATGLGALSAVLSLLGGITAARDHRSAGFYIAAAGIVVGLVTAGIPASWMYKATHMPLIHDISTDTINPPQFIAIMPLRTNASNPAEYGGPSVALQQRAAYPRIVPAILAVSPDRAFEQALAAANKMDWQIIASSPAEGRIEATATTFWFGFKDDVVVRITPASGGSRVDIRSVSREGLSDIGTNAKRIERFLLALGKTSAASEGQGGNSVGY